MNYLTLLFLLSLLLLLLFLKRLTRDENKPIMTYMLVQDCNKATIKKEKLEEYEYKVFVGLHSQLLPKP